MAKESIGRIRRKLQLLQQPGIMQLLIDVVRTCDTALLEAECGTDEEYGKVANQVATKLKKEYSQQIATAEIIPKQRDLEELIQSIKDGRE